MSMDGRGRALDNVFIERLWRSLKYEDIYLKAYRNVRDLEIGLEGWFSFHNHEPPPEPGRTPAEVDRGAVPVSLGRDEGVRSIT